MSNEISSINARAIKGATWLAIFRFSSQVVSWVTTIVIARILAPADYGLMEMSTIITGYAFIFNELGLGSAIIQKESINDSELSSVFWFSLVFSIFLAACCFVIAYPTAYIFNEAKVIPLTKAVSVLFILSGLQIIPINLLRKELRFKKIGLFDMVSGLTSCMGMYVIAVNGGGAWTLLGGFIIRSLTKLVLLVNDTRWFPKLHFDYREARVFLRFGIMVAAGQSLFYVYDKSDKFFAGRAWTPSMLGYYSFALQLAKIPTDKIVLIINQVSFSVFAKLQNDKEAFNKFYLGVCKITAILVFPLFVGGFILGEELIKLLLNDKWYPIIKIFKFLCLAQIIVAICAVNAFVHNAQGRPTWNIYYNIIMTIGMTISFYLAVKYGLNAIIIPWFTTYLFINIIWTVITLSKIGISFAAYLNNLVKPVCAVLIMAFAVKVTTTLRIFIESNFPNDIIWLSIYVVLGFIIYSVYLMLYEKQELSVFRSLIKM